MQIKVRLYGRLRDRLAPEKKGHDVLDFSGVPTVYDVLLRLEMHDEPILYAVNNQHEYSESAELADGDRITIFEMTAGG